MKLGVVVNSLGSAEEGQTTYRLAGAAAGRGHQVWVMSAGRFRLEPDGRVYAEAVCPEPRDNSVRKDEPIPSWRADAGKEWVALDDLDVLLLRNNPFVTIRRRRRPGPSTPGSTSGGSQ